MDGTKKPGVGSGGHLRGVDRLHPAMRGRMWKPGQSGNPTGHCGEYGTAMKLAREAAPDAVRRLIELMNSEDERVAVVACNSILDRAFGKPTAAEIEKDDMDARLKAMSSEERLALMHELLDPMRKYLTPAEREVETR